MISEQALSRLEELFDLESEGRATPEEQAELARLRKDPETENEYRALLAFSEAARQSTANVVPPPGIADAVIERVRLEKKQGGPKKPEGGGGPRMAPIIWLLLAAAVGWVIFLGVRHFRPAKPAATPTATPAAPPAATSSAASGLMSYFLGHIVNEDDRSWKVTSECKGGANAKNGSATLPPKGTTGSETKLGFGYGYDGKDLTCTVTLVDGNSTCQMHGGERCTIKGGKLVFDGKD